MTFFASQQILWNLWCFLLVRQRRPNKLLLLPSITVTSTNGDSLIEEPLVTVVSVQPEKILESKSSNVPLMEQTTTAAETVLTPPSTKEEAKETNDVCSSASNIENGKIINSAPINYDAIVDQFNSRWTVSDNRVKQRRRQPQLNAVFSTNKKGELDR